MRLSKGWVFFNLALACACIFWAYRWRPEYFVYEVAVAFVYAAVVSFLSGRIR